MALRQADFNWLARGFKFAMDVDELYSPSSELTYSAI
jgi:hypothetical protein